MTKFTCENCSTKFSGNSQADCPACAQYLASMLMSKRGSSDPLDHLEELEIREEPKSSKEKVVSPKISTKEASLADLVAAQNRTTHAVRALAEFFFTWLKFSVFGAIFYFVGAWIFDSFESNAFGVVLIVAGALTTLIGFFVALNSGLDELDRSKP